MGHTISAAGSFCVTKRYHLEYHYLTDLLFQMCGVEYFRASFSGKIPTAKKWPSLTALRQQGGKQRQQKLPNDAPCDNPPKKLKVCLPQTGSFLFFFVKAAAAGGKKQLIHSASTTTALRPTCQQESLMRIFNDKGLTDSLSQSGGMNSSS